MGRYLDCRLQTQPRGLPLQRHRACFTSPIWEMLTPKFHLDARPAGPVAGLALAGAANQQSKTSQPRSDEQESARLRNRLKREDLGKRIEGRLGRPRP